MNLSCYMSNISDKKTRNLLIKDNLSLVSDNVLKGTSESVKGDRPLVISLSRSESCPKVSHTRTPINNQFSQSSKLNEREK